jgi:putative Ig domain-containing protein
MKRVAVAAATALLCLACGDSSDAPAPSAAPAPRADQSGSSENQAPTIESAAIVPTEASAADALAVEVHADDADNDRLTMTYEWYRNGEQVPELHESNVPAGTFARGDRIHAIVNVSDRLHQVSLQTNEIAIANAPPRVDQVGIAPLHPTGLDLIEAKVTGHDADSDDFTYDYRWIKNGQPVPGVNGSRLPPGTVKRGDQLAVEVVARDSEGFGPSVACPPITIQNASPAINSQPNYELGASGHYSYDVAAKDPDGDEPLRYELLEAPPGMTVDVTSGHVTWDVPANAKGTYQIELAVSDGYGGQTLQHYALALDWNEAPASASEGAAGKGSEAGSNTKKSAAKKADAHAAQKGRAAVKAKTADEDDTESDQDQEQGEEADQE